MMQWLRRSFIAGFFVTVPLFISVATLVWLFRLIDGFVGPIYAKYLGREMPGLGLLTTLLAILVIGILATNVVGKRLLQRAESSSITTRLKPYSLSGENATTNCFTGA